MSKQRKGAALAFVVALVFVALEIVFHVQKIEIALKTTLDLVSCPE